MRITLQQSKYEIREDTKLKKKKRRLSMVVQWLKNWHSSADDLGSIPGWGTKSPYAVGQLGLQDSTERFQMLQLRLKN